jgi:O-antigen/teichoic acid export membrane protein
MDLRILFGGIASWFSRGTSILLGIVLMPVLFRRLPKEEVGVWLLLAQSWGALALLDFGFGTILTRRIAFTVGKNGKGMRGECGEGIIEETCDLVATGQRVYHCLALAAFVISFSSGFFYLRSIELRELSVTKIWFAWGMLCFAQAISISSAVWTCLLQGVGYVGWDSVLSALVNSLTLLVQIVLVIFGGGLLSLASTAAVGTLTQRFLIIWFARTRRAEFFKRQGAWRGDLFREMIPPSFRAWMTCAGYLLVASSDQFFIAAHNGASAIPAYRAAFLLVINLHFLSGVFSGASQVFVSQLWRAGELEQIQAILKRNAMIGILAMGCGAGAILSLGPVFFDWWLGPGNFVGYPVLGILLATFVLEHHANVFASCGRATDDEAYGLTSVLAGILKLALAVALTTRFGLVGLAMSTLIAQAATNDWFMVYRSLKRLRIRFREHVRDVLIPCFLAFLTALGLGLAMQNALRGQRPVIRIATVATITGILLCGSLWRLALSRIQRDRILSIMRCAS